MLVQLNKCVVRGSDLQRGHRGVCSELGQGATDYSGDCCFGVMYGEWYGVCDFVVLSVVEVCAQYGGINVVHVCLDIGVYGVGVCVNLCGVVICCLFLTSGCCLL